MRGSESQVCHNRPMSDPNPFEAVVSCPLCGHPMRFRDAESLLGQEIECRQCGKALEMDSGEVVDGELGYFLLDRRDIYPE